MTYHGEYKVPGGKLVVVDFEVIGERFANMCITGDFFVFPEDALSAVAKSLEGMPIDTPANDLQVHMNQAMGNDAELLGFGLIDVVAAIRRALA
jgi:lipoate---protein ligase